MGEATSPAAKQRRSVAFDGIHRPGGQSGLAVAQDSIEVAEETPGGKGEGTPRGESTQSRKPR
jgi:hypothetical protein